MGGGSEELCVDFPGDNELDSEGEADDWATHGVENPPP